MPNKKILSRIHIGVAIFYFLAALAVAFIVGVMASDLVIALVFLLLVSIPSIIHLICLWGVKKEKPWSKYSSGIMAILLLMAFPLGTLVGGYMLYLLKDWSKK